MPPRVRSGTVNYGRNKAPEVPSDLPVQDTVKTAQLLVLQLGLVEAVKPEDKQVDLDCAFLNKSQTAKLLTKLKTLKDPVFLDLSWNEFDEKTLAQLIDFLPNFPHLESLALESVKMSSANLEKLARVVEKCPNLTFLNIAGNGFSSKDSQNLIDIFKACEKLNSITLDRAELNFGVSGFKALAEEVMRSGRNFYIAHKVRGGIYETTRHEDAREDEEEDKIFVSEEFEKQKSAAKVSLKNSLKIVISDDQDAKSPSPKNPDSGVSSALVTPAGTRPATPNQKKSR